MSFGSTCFHSGISFLQRHVVDLYMRSTEGGRVAKSPLRRLQTWQHPPTSLGFSLHRD